MAWQSMQWAAHGSASSRAGAIGWPQRRHVPNVPASSRASAASTSSSCWLAGRAGRGRAAARRPGSPPRPASRRSSGRAPGWPRRAPRASRARARPRGPRGSPRSSSSIGGLYARRCRRSIDLYSLGVPTKETRTMAIAIDPVCGMEVDTATSPAVPRARRHDLLVLRQGLPARVPGRPGRVPAPGRTRRRCHLDRRREPPISRR